MNTKIDGGAAQLAAQDRAGEVAENQVPTACNDLEEFGAIGKEVTPRADSTAIGKPDGRERERT